MFWTPLASLGKSSEREVAKRKTKLLLVNDIERIGDHHSTIPQAAQCLSMWAVYLDARFAVASALLIRRHVKVLMSGGSSLLLQALCKILLVRVWILLEPWEGNWMICWLLRRLYMLLVEHHPSLAGIHLRTSGRSQGTIETVVIACTAWSSKMLERSWTFQSLEVLCQSWETMAGRGRWVTGSNKWSWIDSQIGHQGLDQMELLPDWICRVEPAWRSFQTWRIDDQKMEWGPWAPTVQKEAFGKYFALRTAVRKEFLLVAIFQAAWIIKSYWPCGDLWCLSLHWQISSHDLKAIGEVGLSS